jgi:pimeloyl-ACP methyl ester carboxylesterase
MFDMAKLLDLPVISRRVFYPRRTTVPPDLIVASGECRLGCYVRRAQPDAVWVIYFHGNGELAAESVEDCASLFTGAGVNVCFAEYRGYGTSDGEPALVGMLGDGEQVMATLGVPAERVVAFGRSLGSVYAIELARRLPRLGGLVLESGVASLADLWTLVSEAKGLGCAASFVETAIMKHFDHRAKLGAYAGPLLVMHAEGDRLVARSHADRLYAWGGGSDKRLVVFPNGDHNTILWVNAVAYVAELREFLRRIGAGC